VPEWLKPDADLHAGIALHHGEVSYGNIGSGRQLDFTVIGPAVSLASRIQALCGDQGRPSLLMSARFAELLGMPGAAPVGRYNLKDFSSPSSSMRGTAGLRRAIKSKTTSSGARQSR
jgi:adenylate cyclase